MPMSDEAKRLSMRRWTEPVQAPIFIMEASVETLIEVLADDLLNLPSGYARELLDRLKLDDREASDPTLIPDSTIWEALCNKIGVEAVRAAGIAACEEAIRNPSKALQH